MNAEKSNCILEWLIVVLYCALVGYLFISIAIGWYRWATS